jgi:hypothetical protein
MIDFTGWRYYQFKGENIGIVSPDSLQSKSIQDPDVAKWLELGNTPLPADGE